MPNQNTEPTKLPDKLEMIFRDFKMDDAHKAVILSSFEMMYDAKLAQATRKAEKNINWDLVKNVMSDHVDRAFRDFNPEYFEYGEMRVVGVVIDRAIEEIKEALTQGKTHG